MTTRTVGHWERLTEGHRSSARPAPFARLRTERVITRPITTEPMPISTSRSSGAPVEANDEAADGEAADGEAAVATVGVLPLPGLSETSEAVALPADDVDVAVVPLGVAVEDDVTGCGHEESALPSKAACTPQSVTGTVAPVPGVPVDVELELEPAQVPPALPSSAAETAQAEMGAKTGMDPLGDVVETCEGSHELLAEPSTATTTLHAFTGMTPSTGAF
jgi:hypothetical protein